MSVKLSIYIFLHISLNSKARFKLAAQLSFLNTSFSFSFISLRSSLDNLKLPTVCLPFLISVTLKKGWPALISICNCSLFLSSSTDFRPVLSFPFNLSQHLSVFYAFSFYAVEEKTLEILQSNSTHSTRLHILRGLILGVSIIQVFVSSVEKNRTVGTR